MEYNGYRRLVNGIGGIEMTILHILNYSIPIVSFIGIGFLLDHLSKPDTDKQPE